jgi:hypothetical protein
LKGTANAANMRWLLERVEARWVAVGTNEALKLAINKHDNMSFWHQAA